MKSYGCLKFLGEVWARQAWARANEVELTKMPKNGGRRRKKGGGRKKKVGLACGWRATTGCQSTVALPSYGISFFNFFGFLKSLSFGIMRILMAFWENGYTTPPFFEACLYTWKY
jgi:hypothetical protein